MKDKRVYLKLACILQIIYIISMVIHYFILTKINSDTLFKIPLLLVDLLFTFVLYKESNKDISVLKKDKRKLLVSSVWLLFDAIIPGVIGLLFINSISDKKSNKLPEIKKEDSKNIYLKACVLLFVFILLMFVLPMFKFAEKIPSYVIYILIFTMIMLLNNKELYSNFIAFKNNFKSYIKFVLKRYVIMLCMMVIVTIPIVIFNNAKVSPNQVLINETFNKLPLITLFLSTLYAPFAEECIFRLNLSKLFKNKTIFIIVSGFLFGLLHIIGKTSSISDILYVLQYATLGICLAKAYADSNNIFVSISIHFIQNFLAALVILL